MKKELDPSDILELRKDVCQPGRYYRAGATKNREEWLDLFPALANGFDWGEWFIDLSAPTAKNGIVDLKCQVVGEVFAKLGLHSISYKEAAVKSITEYQKRISA